MVKIMKNNRFAFMLSLASCLVVNSCASSNSSDYIGLLINGVEHSLDEIITNSENYDGVNVEGQFYVNCEEEKFAWVTKESSVTKTGFRFRFLSNDAEAICNKNNPQTIVAKLYTTCAYDMKNVSS